MRHVFKLLHQQVLCLAARSGHVGASETSVQRIKIIGRCSFRLLVNGLLFNLRIRFSRQKACALLSYPLIIGALLEMFNIKHAFFYSLEGDSIMSTTNTSGCNVILLVPVQLAGLSMSRLDKSTQPGVMEQILRCWESGAMTRIETLIATQQSLFLFFCSPVQWGGEKFK